ncbi:unnamed protein product [Cuscuta epithymum]|uniref:RNA polymerase II subunit B1 CTD phosphatase RPAP2 homolog n=1 Tax=Cuscuta epithymum TaxID=186058 RepID=A0AAV0BXK6_9ASTE|nr:unnamed protein product [Cuscuta epithymum]CAH9133872.1 unnamed protein product [Cuscuta epithymum]
MAEAKGITVKDAVHKLQLRLLDGIQDVNKLFAAGSLMSCSDYQDVVTERTIANMCGYPLCSNSLPSSRPHKGHYRISLKEHKVYDLRETYMYCSANCAVNSRAYACNLPEERSSTLNPSKLNDVLRAFEQLGLDSEVDLGRKGDLGFSELKIQERVELMGGKVSLEEWAGPSNAIEGYVPKSDKAQTKHLKRGSGSNPGQLNKKKALIFNDIDFTSCIITDDEYSISKLPSTLAAEKENNSNEDDHIISLGNQVGCLQIHNNDESDQHGLRNGRVFKSEKDHITELSTDPSNNLAGNTLDGGKDASPKTTTLKSSLKPSCAKKDTHSVSWADMKTDLNGRSSLTDSTTRMERDENLYPLASAEACAAALSKAAEAVVSGCDVSSAISEAGIVILPPPHEKSEGDCVEDDEVLEAEAHSQTWPTKPGLPNYDLFESEESCYDSPPEGFNLSLSPFATMFMALFAWISSSSLAFIYGHEESVAEEYSFINGREYPRKIVLTDGRSHEIRQTLAGCLARALPDVVAGLGLRIPISTLEKGMDKLIDTMSFMDPLPPFRMKQWQLIVLLFLDALSVSKIPVLTSFKTGWKILLPKVLDDAGVSGEEYEIMKDHIIPLGRVPQFTMQSGT